MLTDARDRLVGAMAEAGPKELPAIVRELRMTLAELDRIGGAGKVSRVDELAARRAAHVAATTRAPGT